MSKQKSRENIKCHNLTRISILDLIEICAAGTIVKIRENARYLKTIYFLLQSVSDVLTFEAGHLTIFNVFFHATLNNCEKIS